MKPKIKKYIKRAREECINDCQIHNPKSLYRWLDLTVIPCCSMSKEDQKELMQGLEQMTKTIESKQLKLNL